MSAPAFTIAVAAYQAETTLAAALASAAGQHEQDVEIVVVDDGSTDGTGEIADRWAAEDPARRRVVHQANAGLAGARNAGAAAARGRWLVLLDADDWLLPHYLTRMRKLLAAAPAAGLAWGDAWVWHEPSRRFMRGTAMSPYRPAVVPEDPDELFLALLRQNFVYGAATMPLALVEELGGFDPALRAAEDWNLWLRIVAARRAVTSTTEPLAVYRRRAGQMTADTRRMAIGGRDALRSVRDRAGTLPGPLASALDDAIAAFEREAEAAERGRPLARRLLSRAKDPLRPVVDRRLRAPAGVVATFPELARRPPATARR